MVPELEFPEVTKATYFIKDSVFYDLENNHTSAVLSEIQKSKNRFQFMPKQPEQFSRKEPQKTKRYRNF